MSILKSFLHKSTIKCGGAVRELNQSGEILACQEKNRSTETIASEHRDISNASIRGGAAAELDPLGMNAGLINPFPYHSTRPALQEARTYPGFADMMSGSQCRVDGIDMPCSMINGEATLQCPDNDCGPRSITVTAIGSNGQVINSYSFLTGSFQSQLGGNTGFWANGIYVGDGSLNGTFRPIGPNAASFSIDNVAQAIGLVGAIASMSSTISEYGGVAFQRVGGTSVVSGLCIGFFRQRIADSGELRINKVAMSMFIAGSSYLVAFLFLNRRRNMSKSKVPANIFMTVLGSAIFAFSIHVVYDAIYNWRYRKTDSLVAYILWRLPDAGVRFTILTFIYSLVALSILGGIYLLIWLQEKLANSLKKSSL
jgi:hypothetical protein